ncbi:MAG: 3-isopropylmalate dehydratase small subunit [Candidatus Kapaibacterium sp.]|nr:MAG: 3-isopropylmalate dehydratase small subunit [Candidatus Kapabacteria bacterium]
MGKVIYVLGDDISTDIIYPGRYMATVLPTETPQYVFGDIKELHEMLVNHKFEPGDFIVAGKNFGCGSSREQAVSTLRGYDIKIVAKNFARIFLQNSINLGLPTYICPDIEAEVGDELEIVGDKIINKTKNKEFALIPHHKSRQAIIDAGGLIPYTRKLLLENQAIEGN